MKSKIAIICLVLLPCIASAQSLKIPSRAQEKINWSWAATSQMVLDAYGVYKTQAEIAEFATPGGLNSISGYGTSLYTDKPGSQSVKSVLNYYKGISSVSYARPLTLSEVQSNLSAGRPIIATRVSGMVVIYGISGNYIYYMEPWPGFGPMVEHINTFTEGNGYPWTASLVLTTPIGPRPTRIIPENQVSKTYGLYAFDLLSMGSGSKCFADATTTTNYCRVGSGWFPSLDNGPNTNQLGMALGDNTKVGTALSNGPVVLYSGASVTGTLYMKDLSTLIRSANTQVGALVQHNVGFVGFGYGTVDYAYVPKDLVVIAPNQPRRTLTPSYYWNYTIQSNSPVRLTAGDYFFNTLRCESCTMEIDASQGPVRIYVTSGISWTGNMTHVSGGPEKLLFTYTGSNTWYINGKLDGTVLAPCASVFLGNTNKQYKGMYTAKKLYLSTNTEVRWVPFAHYTY